MPSVEDVKVWRIVLNSVRTNVVWGGWGVFLLDSTGMFTVVSDYGNYAYWWSHFGTADFREFVCGLVDSEYTIKKLNPTRVYDGDATFQEVKKAILELRRGSPKRFKKQWASETWDDLHHYYDKLQTDHDFSRWLDADHRIDDAYELRCTRPESDVTAFVTYLLPRLQEYLRNMLQEEKLVQAEASQLP